MKPREVDSLQFEMDRLQRSIRGNQAETGVTREVQLRQRRLQRLTSARRVLQAYLTKVRR